MKGNGTEGVPNTRMPSCEDESNVSGLRCLKESSVSGGADEVRWGRKKRQVMEEFRDCGQVYFVPSHFEPLKGFEQ